MSKGKRPPSFFGRTKTSSLSDARTTTSHPLPRLAGVVGEFERHDAILIGCAQLIRNFPQVFVNVVRSLYRRIQVVCLVNEEDEILGRVLLAAADIPKGSVDFLIMPSVSMWARDWSPLAGFDSSGKRRFMGFELRHLRTSADTTARPELSRMFESPVIDVPLTHEGGNILCNGEGICLTSTTVLLKNASRQYDAKKIGEVLAEYFGATQWAYLDPLSGEPTGHIDLFCCFLARDLVIVGEFDPKVDSINASLLDRAAEILATLKTSRGPMRVERIPMPPPIDGKYRSYTNCIIANGSVVVPLFPEISDAMDQQALATYKRLMPDYDVIGIDILDLSSLGGGLHCLTSHVCLPRRGMLSGGLAELDAADRVPVDFVGVRRG